MSCSHHRSSSVTVRHLGMVGNLDLPAIYSSPSNPSTSIPHEWPPVGSLYKVNPDAKGFSALNALYLARLSALVYSEAGVVKQKVCDELGYTDFYWFGASGSNQGFVAAQESIMVIIFRGTDAADDWWTNLNALRLTTPHGEIHKGFHDALEELWIDEAGPDPVTATGPLKGGMLETIKALQAGKNERPVFLGGHSLGGALASVAAARLALEVPEVNVSEVGTIGCPRVFDNNYAAVYDDVLEDKTFRVVNNNDGVPRGSPGL
ncbi:unnamed protein product, partial [Discosporangium mesarthrocarpum]